MRLPITLTCMLAALFSTQVNARGIPITPGLWEVVTTVSMPMMPQPKVTTTTKCMVEDELSPDEFNQDMGNPCEISQVVINRNTGSWSMRCPTQGGMAMVGQWKFTSTGKSISGNGTMAMNMGGQEMEIKMNWQGKRVGNCP